MNEEEKQEIEVLEPKENTSMFANIFVYGFERAKGQAFGFYIAHLVLTVLGASLVGATVALITGENDFESSIRLGNVIAIFVCLIISTLIVTQKKEVSFKTVSLILASGILAVFLGALAGLIPAAYLTTLEKNT